MKSVLKEKRLSKGWSQEELAEKAEVSRPTISKLENGEDVVVKSSTLLKIAKAFECGIDDIFLQ